MPTTPAPATAEPGDVAAALAAVSAAALTASDEADLLDVLTPAVYELLGADQLHLIEISPDGAVGHAHVLLTDGRPPQGYTIVLDDRPSGTAHVASSGESLHVPDALDSPHLRQDFIRRFEVRTMLFHPLAWAGAVRWVAVVARARHQPFTDPEIDLARATLNVYAAGLALLEAQAAVRARADQEGALARAAEALTTTQDAAVVLAAICREACGALGADSAGVYLADGTGGGVATAGHQTPEGWLGYRMRPGEGVGGRVLQTGKAAFTNAYQRETDLPSQPGLQRLQTAVAVPVRSGGTLHGALSVGFERLRRIDAGDLRTLEGFAHLSALACAR